MSRLVGAGVGESRVGESKAGEIGRQDELGLAESEPMLEPDEARSRSLVGLLGGPRATILRTLKRERERSAPELADVLGITDVAVRRHLAVLEREGLIAERTVKQGRGRPVARYRLTARGEGLFPHRYREMAHDLLAFLEDELGREGLRAYLRWRQDRETEQYAAAVDGEELQDRLLQLAGALNEAGFEAGVEECEEGFRLTQSHCAIYETARRHPEMCAHEAAMFRRVLGDVQVSRRETLAKGDNACVCMIIARPGRTQLPTIQT
ncbi:MAG: transcriptional regulator [Actinomycetota bacterium]|nr:transcriptional regulator [Actinomycetota bacterium]